MAEPHIHKNLADKRKEIQAHIGSLESNLEQARRDLSAIIATERVFQSRGPKVTAYMELAALFPRHELPKLARAALECTPDGMTAPQIAAHVIAAKELDTTDRHLRKAVSYKTVQLLRQWEKRRKVERMGKVGTAIVWRIMKWCV
jgi:phage shock protein A